MFLDFRSDVWQSRYHNYKIYPSVGSKITVDKIIHENGSNHVRETKLNRTFWHILLNLKIEREFWCKVRCAKIYFEYLIARNYFAWFTSLKIRLSPRLFGRSCECRLSTQWIPYVDLVHNEFRMRTLFLQTKMVVSRKRMVLGFCSSSTIFGDITVLIYR